MQARISDPAEVKQIVELIVSNEAKRARGGKSSDKSPAPTKKSASTNVPAPVPPPTKKPKNFPNDNGKNGWCKIGDIFLTREMACLHVMKAVEEGLPFYAALLSEMLEGCVKPSNKLIAQVRFAWNSIEPAQKNIVIEQGMSNCYGRAWRNEEDFKQDIGISLQGFFNDQIFGALARIRERNGKPVPVAVPMQHSMVFLPVDRMEENGFDPTKVKKEMQEDKSMLPEKIPAPKTFTSARLNPKAFWPSLEEDGVEETTFTLGMNDWRCANQSNPKYQGEKQ